MLLSMDSMQYSERDKEETLCMYEKARTRNSSFRDTLPRESVLVEVEGDGNCLFRAASRIMYGTEDHHLMVRAKACEYIRRYPERCGLPASAAYDTHSPLAALEHVCLDQFLYGMQQPRVWGDNICLNAIAAMYRRHAVVYVMSAVPGEGAVQHQEYLSSLNVQRLPEMVFANESNTIHFNAVENEATRTNRLRTPPGVAEDRALASSQFHW